MVRFKVYADGETYIVTAKYMQIENGILTLRTHHVSGQTDIKQAFSNWDYVKKLK